MCRLFSCISTDFDTITNFVLVRHLTEPAPYMGQVLSPMGAHSVSGDTAFFTSITPCGRKTSERKRGVAE